MHKTCVPIHNEHKPKPTQNPIHFAMFLSCLNTHLSHTISFNHSFMTVTLPWRCTVYQTTFIHLICDIKVHYIYFRHPVVKQTQWERRKTVLLGLHWIEALKPSTTGLGRKKTRSCWSHQVYLKSHLQAPKKKQMWEEMMVWERRGDKCGWKGKGVVTKQPTKCMMATHQVLTPPNWCRETESGHDVPPQR